MVEKRPATAVCLLGVSIVFFGLSAWLLPWYIIKVGGTTTFYYSLTYVRTQSSAGVQTSYYKDIKNPSSGATRLRNTGAATLIALVLAVLCCIAGMVTGCFFAAEKGSKGCAIGIKIGVIGAGAVALSMSLAFYFYGLDSNKDVQTSGWAGVSWGMYCSLAGAILTASTFNLFEFGDPDTPSYGGDSRYYV